MKKGGICFVFVLLIILGTGGGSSAAEVYWPAEGADLTNEFFWLGPYDRLDNILSGNGGIGDISNKLNGHFNDMNSNNDVFWWSPFSLIDDMLKGNIDIYETGLIQAEKGDVTFGMGSRINLEGDAKIKTNVTILGVDFVPQQFILGIEGSSEGGVAEGYIVSYPGVSEKAISIYINKEPLQLRYIK